MSEKPVDSDLAEAAEMLLGLDVGDRHILEQIHRAATNGEMISNHERAYVDSLLEKHASAPAGKAQTAAPRSVPETPTGAETPDPTPSRSSSKTLAMAGGAAVAAVAVAVVLLVSLGSPGEVEPVPVLTVGVDSAGYAAGDFVLIEGLSEGAGDGAVDVSITGPSGQVWHENVLPNTDGSFSTIALAGSEGWSAGSYTVRAVHGDLVHESAFSFDSGG